MLLSQPFSILISKTPHLKLNNGILNTQNMLSMLSGSDGAVDMSSANGLVGTGFASRYQLQPRMDCLSRTDG